MRIRMRRTSRMITRVHAHAVCCCWDGSGRRCCSGCSGGAAWHRERTTRKVRPDRGERTGTSGEQIPVRTTPAGLINSIRFGRNTDYTYTEYCKTRTEDSDRTTDRDDRTTVHYAGICRFRLKTLEEVA